ncbi:lytic transglycosylase [Rhodobacter xanthinilyticus]|uniref:Lytic transglycosylase n=1 Tax=Rhodobacter xanthinilyticus TaxID=1850250 RepID=A0A1D9MG69_9RHOB|nr:lytic murein transglycosylase [Rhodobacter xanthinilyticus]AOZ70759.1 lytic transglycosylase [Rhodobacter xanthinilyticus]
MRRLALAFTVALSVPGGAFAQCGGDFGAFLGGLKAEMQGRGLSAAQADGFLRGARLDQKVLRADRAQGVFRKDFIAFSGSVISQNRLANGARMAQKYADVFARAERDYGVSRGVLLAFWGLETDFGAVQGDFNTRDALVTLAHDCRRPELFRPQVLAAAELYRRGDFDPARNLGAWAGEIGQVQMLPEDILRNGVDGDGDGHVNLKGSAPDALMSGAKMIAGMGWRAGEPWMQEIVVPEGLDWSKTGLDHELSTADWARMGVRARSGALAPGKGSILLPMGRKGPAFMVFPNFRVLFNWNQSFVYVTTAAYFATRLEGAPKFDPRAPEPGLGAEQMKALQQKLAARGHDVGPIDGILGARTRVAVQREQARLGLPADAWPTAALLRGL